MKHFSAQYIYTNAGIPLKRGVITTEDDGTIIGIEDNSGNLAEKQSVQFYNGIIVPGFINCHCHLELSYLKDKIEGGKGLTEFLKAVTVARSNFRDLVEKSIIDADNEMFGQGVVLCADICNTTDTFLLKKKSKIKYISLLEVFGIDLMRSETRMQEVLSLAKQANEIGLPTWIVPHSVYSVSLPLFRLIKEHASANKISSIHFMESSEEETFLKYHTGPLMDVYQKFLSPSSELKISFDHASAVMREMTSSGNLLLIHNVFVSRDQIKTLKEREGLYWCLCPNSNLRIENKLPPVEILSEEGCKIVIGTDSLASNNTLSIIDELKTIQEHFPSTTLETLIKWATMNGAAALGDENMTGSIEPGKRPGLVLLKNVDLVNLKLRQETSVQRLI